ncbi:restriction endonuclease [Rhodococcus sp. 2G]|uniref:restriction endonuclease n=1 Tax=Rhodococcus sp. 2G TaxID=1570939 RepID=UPI0018DBF079|nr:restriction endonuclease [Rhodococcus sp. 2G]
MSTSVLWDSIVGAQLEELLFGLLDAMGAKELAWRAGSHSGVTAIDNGRDLEAVFVQPTPDGEEDRTRWWIESKGRGTTVPRDEVTTAVNNLTARNDIDVFVFCTNSRFSNPTRDWVADWQKLHPRPKVRLWDRDTLDRLIRDHPTVAARTLPQALDDAQRLTLLSARFWELGETPTQQDLDYFWERQSVVQAADDERRAIAMFTYAESDEGLAERPWGTLIPDEPLAITETLYQAAYELPRLGVRPLARPVDGGQTVRAAAYLIMSVMPYWPANRLHKVIFNLGDCIEGDHLLKNPEFIEAWTKIAVTPILGRIQDELADVCTDDCPRVITDPVRAFAPPILGKQYWRRFGLGDAPDARILTIEEINEPCVAGLPLDAHRRCPLISDVEQSVTFLEDLCHVFKFRREYPEDQYWKFKDKPDWMCKNEPEDGDSSEGGEV